MSIMARTMDSHGDYFTYASMTMDRVWSEILRHVGVYVCFLHAKPIATADQVPSN